MGKRTTFSSRGVQGKKRNPEHGLSLRDKINNRMYELEDMMCEQMHLSNPRKVLDHMATITKFWSALEETDRDYIEGCRFALEERHDWVYT